MIPAENALVWPPSSQADRSAVMFSTTVGPEAASIIPVETQKKRAGSKPPRGRADAAGSLCKVEGCPVVLSDESARSVRVKICRSHQRDDSVSIDGGDHRFCQQCMRVHLVSAFDGGKRTCRARLARHGARRKKKGAEKRSSKTAPDLQASLGFYAEPEASLADLQAVRNMRQSSSSSGWALTGDQVLARYVGTTALNAAEDICPVFTDEPLASSMSLGSDPGTTSSPEAGPRTTSGDQPDMPQLHPDTSHPPAQRLDQLFDNMACQFWKVTEQLGLVNGGMAPGAASHFWSVGSRSPLGEEPAGSGESPLFHLSVKIMGVTPENLPHDLLEQLQSMVESPVDHVEGAIRPGCVHLGIDMWMRDAQSARQAVESFLSSLEDRLESRQPLPWGNYDADVHLPDQDIKIREGLATVSCRAPGPEICEVDPLVISDSCLVLSVCGLHDVPFKLLCRNNGRYHELVVKEMEFNGQATFITAEIPPVVHGLGWIELVQEVDDTVHISRAVPVLATDLDHVAAELSELAVARPTPQTTVILRDLARVLHPLPSQSPPLQLCLDVAIQAASFGWVNTLDETLRVAEEAGYLSSLLTDSGSTGLTLLGAAARSCNENILQLVIDVAEEEGILSEACAKRCTGGFTPLHFAAGKKFQAGVVLLLSCSPDSWEIWEFASCDLLRLTPKQMLYCLHGVKLLLRSEAEVNGLTEHEVIDDSSARQTPVPRLAPASVPSTDFVEGLHATVTEPPPAIIMMLSSKLSAILSAVLCLTMASSSLNAGKVMEVVCATLLATVALHVILPSVIYHMYYRRCCQLRQMAKSAGLAVASDMTFDSPSVQQAYDRFLMSRNFTLPEMLFWLTTAMGPSWVLFCKDAPLSVVLYNMASIVVALAVILPVRLVALRRMDRAAVLKINMFMTAFIHLVPFLPTLQAWAQGLPNPTVPGLFLNSPSWLQYVVTQCIANCSGAVIEGVGLPQNMKYIFASQSCKLVALVLMSNVYSSMAHEQDGFNACSSLVTNAAVMLLAVVIKLATQLSVHGSEMRTFLRHCEKNCKLKDV